MTKKHFEAIAEVLRDARLVDSDPTSDSTRIHIAWALADTFKNFNPSFDKARFLKAADAE